LHPLSALTIEIEKPSGEIKAIPDHYPIDVVLVNQSTRPIVLKSHYEIVWHIDLIVRRNRKIVNAPPFDRSPWWAGNLTVTIPPKERVQFRLAAESYIAKEFLKPGKFQLIAILNYEGREITSKQFQLTVPDK
jgi:hypothetical protein